MLNTDHFERVAEIVGKFLDENGKQLPHTKFAQLVTLVYERDTDDELTVERQLRPVYRGFILPRDLLIAKLFVDTQLSVS